jgi:hypothetical protein
MKLIMLPCFRCVTKLVIIFCVESYGRHQSRISRCISEGLCEEDQGFPIFLMGMKNDDSEDKAGSKRHKRCCVLL